MGPTFTQEAVHETPALRLIAKYVSFRMLHFQQPTHALGTLIQQTRGSCINRPVHYHGIHDYHTLSKLRRGPETWYTTTRGSDRIIVQGPTI